MAKAAGKKAPKKASKKSAAKKSARKASAKKAAPKKATAKKSAAKKSASKKAPAKKTAARKSAAKKSTAKKGTARKSAARKAPAKKSPARKSTAKKTAARKSPAKKAAPRKSAAKKSAAKTGRAKTSPAKTAPAKSASTRKSPTPTRARVLSREGTPVARKVTIRTAVSRPTSPRKTRDDAPPRDAQMQDAVETTENVEPAVDEAPEAAEAAEGELEIDVVQSQEPAFFLGLLAAIGALEAFLDEETEETRAEAERRADDLIKAFQEPAILDDGQTLDEDLFTRLVEEAGANERMAQWLAELPKSEHAQAFFDKKPEA